MTALVGGITIIATDPGVGSIGQLVMTGNPDGCRIGTGPSLVFARRRRSLWAYIGGAASMDKKCLICQDRADACHPQEDERHGE